MGMSLLASIFAWSQPSDVLCWVIYSHLRTEITLERIRCSETSPGLRPLWRALAAIAVKLHPGWNHLHCLHVSPVSVASQRVPLNHAEMLLAQEGAVVNDYCPKGEV